MQTLANFLASAERFFLSNELFFGHGTNNAWDEAVAIACFVLNLPANVSTDVLQRELTEAEFAQMFNLMQRRVVERIPLAYLIKQAWFCGEKFYVDERVIIPRSPFAELIKNKFSSWCNPTKINSILDLCTGSGCIGIACAKEFAAATVDLIDLSAEALEVAQLNITQHKLQDRVFAIESNLFSSILGRKYDIILSNPPYVSPKEHYTLPEEYHYEPKLALISGSDGFDCVRAILSSAATFLHEEGLLFVEVGSNWRAFAKQYPKINFIWINFQHGGDGVFMLTKKQLEDLVIT